MHRHLLPALLVLPILCATGRADPAGRQWQAISNTAASITGDITVTPDRITFAGGHALILSQPTALPRFRAEGSPVAATRYRVASPADPILLNGNRLCGGRTPVPVTYIVLWTPRKFAGDTAPRSLAAFSGTTPPTGTDSPGLCGTFRYEASPAAR
ncbi:hypothetical protein [Roseomonas gilardii]|uniref:hypothetical protein n=1 Tax=Roseomonas gilardii TaxID=257708 RepID=UPI000A46D551|nr:hypothetical protein [Roseomonas gilardii]